MTVLEVPEPARQRLVHRPDSCSQAAPMSASRFAPNRRFQFGYTLSSRPAVATLKVITQKVKATTLRGVHDAGSDKSLGYFRSSANADWIKSTFI
jgi:hypothetical protein